jgi:ribonuclease-3
MWFWENRVLGKYINLDKVAFKEVNFKSKLLEWSQKNKVHMEYRMLKQKKDDNGSPIFSFQVMLEGVEGEKGSGFSKKEAQQLASKDTLQRLKREPQFVEAVFKAKSDRTKMEEEPTMMVPDPEKEQQDFIISNDSGEFRTESVEFATAPQESFEEKSVAAANSKLEDEFDLSDITHKEKSREDIIAEAEAAAFAEG